MGLSFENLVPRVMVISEPERSIPRFGLFLQILYIILEPLVHLIYKTLGSEIDSREVREELKNMVEFESEEGGIEEEKKEMISGIFESSDTAVREVMIPRIDVVSAEITTDIKDIIIIVTEAGFSRIPIFRETIDNIDGILYAKDLLKLLVEPEKDWKIEEIMREPYFVPENKKIDEMMREFKRRKIHIAIVVDEYGGTAGLITLEDLLEEIVGEIQDEYDIEEEQPYLWIDTDTLVADAKIDIHDLNEAINSTLPDEGFETLGGLIYSMLGRIPAKGESLEVDNLKLIIEGIEGNRISKVRIVKNRSEEDSN
jgi:putative hemolysin